MKRLEKAGTRTCPDCDGKGKVPEIDPEVFHERPTGKIVGCYKCSGSGKVHFDLFELTSQEYSDVVSRYETKKKELKDCLRKCEKGDEFNINESLRQLEYFKPKRIMTEFESGYWGLSLY
jgi:DnaJ-class molecular chaperone